jgi:hypothetical protein
MKKNTEKPSNGLLSFFLKFKKNSGHSVCNADSQVTATELFIVIIDTFI